MTGALAYAFASYSAVIVMVGHTTKVSSMGYAPAVLAGLILLTQRKYLLGFIVTLIFSTQLFYQNHIQIVYYTFLIAIIIGIAYLVQAIKNKDLVHFGKVAGLALVAGVMGMLSMPSCFFPPTLTRKKQCAGEDLNLPSPEWKKTKQKVDWIKAMHLITATA